MIAHYIGLALIAVLFAQAGFRTYLFHRKVKDE